MSGIKILTSLHTLPNITSVNTLFFENFLPILRKRTEVKIFWLVYQPDKLDLEKPNNSNEIILDIHNYRNAVDIIKKEKPDLIFANADQGLMDYALSMAGKYLGIPVISGFYSDNILDRSRAKLIQLSLTRFFESSIPTDTENVKKKFMRRGRFFVYKYFFLLKTQQAVKMNFFKIIKEFFILIRAFVNQAQIPFDSRFANDLHWLQSEDLIEILVKAGFQKSSLVVTGNPIYDNVLQKLQNFQPKKISYNKIKVLLITDSLYEHGFWTKVQRDTIVKEIATEISKNKNEMSLTLKIHPSSENISEYRTIIDEIDKSIKIFQQGDIIEFILDTDVVLSFLSSTTALLYGLIARKPIVICNFYDAKNDLFLNKGLALECKESGKLLSVIHESMTKDFANNSKINDFIRSFFYKLDGHAADRICDSIMTLLQNRINTMSK